MNLPIQDMIESIGKSISQAQDGLEQYSIRRFFDYFEPNMTAPDGGGHLRAKTQSVAVPSSGDLAQDAVIEVPLVALAHHNHVLLEQVKIRMNINTVVGEDQVVRMDLDTPSPKADAAAAGGEPPKEQCAPCANCLELVFHVSDPSEGISRVVQDIVKKL